MLDTSLFILHDDVRDPLIMEYDVLYVTVDTMANELRS